MLILNSKPEYFGVTAITVEVTTDIALIATSETGMPPAKKVDLTQHTHSL